MSKEILAHYREFQESQRLFSDVGELERVRTQDVLRRHLPPPPATILDVGGAAGVYALPLARQGYDVHLFDLVPHHVEQALAASASQPTHPLASCSVSDARNVDRPSGSADALLLFGPLYHLTDRADRISALREAHRLLKPGGLLFAAAISRFASLIDGLARDLVADPDFVAILRQDLRDGQHRNPTQRLDYFTTTFFHLPGELRQELEDAGFVVEKLLGVEGPVWQAQTTDLLLELLRTVEEDSSLLGASPHLIAIGRK